MESYMSKINKVIASPEGFITIIKGSDLDIASNDLPFFGFDKNDDVFIEEATINWNVDIEYRSFGIKSMTPYITHASVTGTHGDESFEKDIDTDNIEINLENDDYNKDLHLYPALISIRDKKCIVSFYS